MTVTHNEAAPDSRCHECGACLPDKGACIDHFHALLALEWEVLNEGTFSGGGEAAHYRAVTAYVLQHPESMGYTAEGLAGARRVLADHLAGRMPLHELRRRVRRAADGPARITRREGEPAVRWRVAQWPMTVEDVLEGGTARYLERVTAWAECVVETLDAAST